MNALHLVPAGVFLVLFVVMLIRAGWLKRQIQKRDGELADARKHAEDTQLQCEETASKLRTEGATLVAKQIAEVDREGERVRAHLESEVHRLRAELEPLRRFASLRSDESQARSLLEQATEEARALRAQSQLLLERAKTSSEEQRSEALAKARDARERAEATLAQATREAGRIVTEAHQRAESIAGDAYTALREKDHLEDAVKAIRNVIDGYGDRYIVPTRSVLDGLAADFGHTEAGQALRNAREHSKRMVENNAAATCDYAERERRTTAIRFVIDAFNGRVDAVLSREKTDNLGTLEQEIRDAFNLGNLNGAAFRNAQILPAYLDSRLNELRWAVSVRELRERDREEQRRLQEQIREEEKARRDYERAIKEAEKEERTLREALEIARQEVAGASTEARAKFEREIAMLNQRLAEAEAKGQRAKSMAEQTRAGNVYIISNVGSFGENVFKIGMTRRLNPIDRIWELSDASVPFDFDIHAMIKCDNAPTLERRLHEKFEDLRVNRVNPRKEFFNVPLERVRDLVKEEGLEAVFTMAAAAHEYRESLAIARMTPEERSKYHLEEPVGVAD
ncbi:MAG: DUF4041 domain-containing protein [Opitutaceae bacterium]|nr:DUF4041 domain-containing protein [Opitutaceae bacterium]